MREWFAYRLQSRSNEAQTLLHSRKLFQQFIVEGYTMVESERLSYIRNNQKKLRVDKYSSLQSSSDTGTTKGLTKGKRVILPSTFVGSPRYMDQLYFDGMAICSHVGFPNLFITLTCNPNWPEIRRLLSPLNLKPTDRPDIVSRIFRLRYEHMLSYLTNDMHTIEFQKRGLPHVHLFLFLHLDNKYPSSTDIDEIISVEIPSHEDDPELYRLVENHMIHGPCGILQPNSPCMKEGKCSHFYPKQFQPQTLLDSNGYPDYHRRNNGHSISKNGYDRVTAVMVSDSNDTTQNVNIQNDELKEYLDCRYISPCEAAWRIFAFPIHGRKPGVERLYFHLPDQHNILYEDHDDIDDVLSKPTISDSKFLAWMNTNKGFAKARNLTYSQFVSKFVYNKRNRSWQPRKKGYTIGRLIWVPLTTGELFYLRMMLGAMTKPEEVWNQCWHWLADDIAYQYSKSTMNSDEQKTIYDRIIQAVNNNQGGMFFLYGFGGTRKTFIWRTLASSLRTENQIVIIVASSGIASLLLPGGRTAHSRFKIPVPIFEDSTCNIHQGTQLAKLLNQTSLIIWDEAPMAHKFCFEALDQSLRDIFTNKSNSNQIFGGKVIVFGGDFRQILPVIPRGTRSDIVNAIINSSYLWDSCEILTLTKNMRLHSNLESVDEQETATFAKWILDIGDGIIGDENDGYATIQVPAHLLITQYDDPISAIVKSTFPNLDQHHNNHEFFKSKAILASINETVEQINHYILSFIPGDHMEYLSSDSIDKSETSEDSYFQSITTEFLNSLNTSSLPTHSIKLKIGSPIMLFRNLDQNQGLCNGTRLVVTKMAKHVIAAEIISSKNIGLVVYIPRMSMSPSQSPWPFKLLRRQFLIMLSYAMTINKSQGQSLSMVGLYLPKPVFTHGQLYVALSRVNSAKGLKILIHNDEQKSMNSTTNVVFKEVFRNIKR
ncbi:ATP-dependent DNA helicase PIF1 [Glycine max]|nr:ATP-dependent DNA helicase PIF1 [Glycine max]